jgi:CHAD domain-containing protein
MWVEFLKQVENSLTNRYRRQLNRCLRRRDADAVHDLRVESRKLLTWLNLFRALGLGKTVRPARRQVRRLLHDLAPLRDTQVVLECLNGVPKSLRADTKSLRRRWSRESRKLEDRVRRRSGQVSINLVTRCVHRALKALQRMEREGDDSKVLPGAVVGWFSGLIRQSELALRHARVDRPATVHSLRLSLKRVRYGTEALSPLLYRNGAGFLGQLRRWQALLGEIQDMEMFLGRLEAEVLKYPGRATAIQGLARWLRRRRELRLRRLGTRLNRLHALLDGVVLEP